MRVKVPSRLIIRLLVIAGLILGVFIFVRTPPRGPSPSLPNIYTKAVSTTEDNQLPPFSRPPPKGIKTTPLLTREEFLVRLETTPATAVNEARQQAASKPAPGEIRARYYEGPATLRLATICHGHEDGSAHTGRCGSHAVLELPDGTALFAHHADPEWKSRMNTTVPVQAALFADQAAVVLPPY